MKKDLRNLAYILKHKFWVAYASVRWTRAPLWLLLIHDFSKFTKREWVAYREWFYGDVLGSNKDEWKAAVRLHKARNPHHWEFWLCSCGCKLPREPMPEKYVREMVADWLGAGKAISGRWEAGDFYLKEKDNMQLHPATRRKVEELLKGIPECFSTPSPSLARTTRQTSVIS